MHSDTAPIETLTYGKHLRTDSRCIRFAKISNVAISNTQCEFSCEWMHFHIITAIIGKNSFLAASHVSHLQVLCQCALTLTVENHLSVAQNDFSRVFAVVRYRNGEASNLLVGLGAQFWELHDEPRYSNTCHSFF